MAALARIDFSVYTGVATPLSVSWALVYGPTLAGVGLALSGWLMFEENRRPSRKSFTWSVGVVLLVTLLLTFLTSATSFVGFVLSATITWGSGYQLFRTAFVSAPLAVSFLLVSAAFAAFMVTLLRLRFEHRPTVGMFLALAAILSGIFPSGISVLGTLASLELLWMNVRENSVKL